MSMTVSCQTFEELLRCFRQYRQLAVLPADDPATFSLGWLFFNPNDDTETHYVTMRLCTAKQVFPTSCRAAWGRNLLGWLREMAMADHREADDTVAQAAVLGTGQLRVDLDPS